jgi:DNA-binding transcriptional MerR regulator
MTKWYVKDLSKLTNVTVQTLHHYDRIGVLKPSLRSPSGYRLYSEKDLLKLQQIIALKYFGFKLSQIKDLLSGDANIEENLLAQSRFLEEKANMLSMASKMLQNIISECRYDKSISIQTIVKLIEVYNMTKELEKSWESTVFNPEELKQYALFESELKTRFTDTQRQDFSKNWDNLIAQIGENLDKDPKSEFGHHIAKKIMEPINNLYGNKHANLKRTIWENGYKQGKIDNQPSTEVISWLDKAIDSYYKEPIYAILDKVDSNISPDSEWNSLIEKMFGDSTNLKQRLIESAMSDSRVSNAAKAWLKKL